MLLAVMYKAILQVHLYETKKHIIRVTYAYNARRYHNTKSVLYLKDVIHSLMHAELYGLSSFIYKWKYAHACTVQQFCVFSSKFHLDYRHQIYSNKILSIIYHHSHFLATILDFTYFSPWIFAAAHFFTAWLVVQLNITSFCNCISTFWFPFHLSFFFTADLRKTFIVMICIH